MDPYKDTPEGPAAKAALERLKTCFGKKGGKTIPCDNNCGNHIGITSFSYFMLPESENYKVLFVCQWCAMSLYTKYNYGNKN